MSTATSQDRRFHIIDRATSPPSQLRSENRLLDVFLLNDEVEMMRYRLALHAPITLRTLIIECACTFTGKRKPLYARESLSASEIAAHRIRLIEIPCTPGKRTNRTQAFTPDSDANSTLVDAFFEMEFHQRRTSSLILQQEVAELFRSHGEDFLVHVSDVDELLDPTLLMSAEIRGCRTPVLRHFHYGVHCAQYKPAFARSLVFRASAGWLNFSIGHKRMTWDPLRNMAHGRWHAGACPMTRSFVGWHFSYFLSSEQILVKLKSFSHSRDPFVAKTLAHERPLELIATNARRCVSIRGTKLENELLPYAGVGAVSMHKALPRSSELPTLPGWPHHPAAASTSDFSSIQIEEEARKCVQQLHKAAIALEREANDTHRSGVRLARTSRKRDGIERGDGGSQRVERGIANNGAGVAVTTTPFVYDAGFFMWSSPYDESADFSKPPRLATLLNKKLWLLASQHYNLQRSCKTLEQIVALARRRKRAMLRSATAIQSK